MGRATSLAGVCRVAGCRRLRPSPGAGKAQPGCARLTGLPPSRAGIRAHPGGVRPGRGWRDAGELLACQPAREVRLPGGGRLPDAGVSSCDGRPRLVRDETLVFAAIRADRLGSTGGIAEPGAGTRAGWRGSRRPWPGLELGPAGWIRPGRGGPRGSTGWIWGAGTGLTAPRTVLGQLDFTPGTGELACQRCGPGRRAGCTGLRRLGRRRR